MLYSVVAKVNYKSKLFFIKSKFITKNLYLDQEGKYFINELTKEELKNYKSHSIISIKLISQKNYHVIIFYNKNEYWPITVENVYNEEQAKGLAIKAFYENYMINSENKNIESIQVFQI